ncbi:YbiR family transporter [Tepidamorphus gemmatus]|uniref:YbiR family transporter n=1 Tax=Tepidamorphus gemmatus TaxID=747076 RepID=A0A4R3M8I9_9HYPH|nr:SLC13 family permease [Tepidamorphus gemmatus]TCT09861.1 YbiR family transporter [Tepidamorphus gemmatus]
MSISLAVSCLIFLLIALRQWLPDKIRIWHIMSAGAVVLLAFGEITPQAALAAIDWNVIAYLFGVFLIAAALYDNGISHAIGERIVGAGRPRLAILIFVLATALTSAVLTNDAAAVIGTPIALMLARALDRPAVPILIALCAAVTLGSMASPVGNPQNILIASHAGFTDPVGTFALWLGPPTLIALALAYPWLVRLVMNCRPSGTIQPELPLPHSEPRAWPAWVGMGLLVVLVVGGSLHPGLHVPFGVASLVAAAPVALFSSRRLRTLREVDWPTLIFFVAMFVVTGSLHDSGALQQLLGPLVERLGEPAVTAAIAFVASQLFSNVPVVDLYLRLTSGASTETLMMLAGISTLAGNLFIISAASNVIVVQQAERYGQRPFTFWQFTALMLPVTVMSPLVTWLWVTALGGG